MRDILFPVSYLLKYFWSGRGLENPFRDTYVGAPRLSIPVNMVGCVLLFMPPFDVLQEENCRICK